MSALREDIVAALGQLAMVAAKLELLADLDAGGGPAPTIAYHLSSDIRGLIGRCTHDIVKVKATKAP